MNKSVEVNENMLRETVAEIMFLDPEDIGATDNFDDDLGLDSIDHLYLLAAVEERHGVHLRDEQITNIRNLGDLVKALKTLPAEANS